MAPPKKTVKMDLNSFLNDSTFDNSSWGVDDVDLNKITIPIENVSANTVPLEEIAAAKKKSMLNDSSFNGGRTSRLDPALDGSRREGGFRREREEYPVPDSPPFRAIINNIPWDISPEGVKAWVEDGLNKPGAVEDVDLPVSPSDPSRLKGMAFITFTEREDLVTALTFNATKLNERTVYVSVAAPRRGGGFRGGSDLDWGAARGSNFEPSNRREEPNLDWGSARGSNFREPRPSKREEPNLDWGAARGSNFKEPRPPKREEPELDWGAARGSNFREPRPPKRKEEPELDWSAARGSNFENRQQRSSGFNRQKKKDEPELDWGSARGANFNRRPQPISGRKILAESKAVEEKVKAQNSSFDILRTEDDDDEEEEEEENNEEKEEEEKKDSTEVVNDLATKTAELTVEDDTDDNWEVVGKK
ncbi:hypothetical protein RI543_003574 [Arxiozyma heterogenica]|uniref:RRM domain-containing protein n=1 Tax=Arxiozyma heterogenica TaxID=278026 RepID=A0AAN7WG78_9SACH|nr:hypothetical protein RI543_003574 [Kazachstania heterogenica]